MNFVSYVILKAFGIELNKDYFAKPGYDFSSKLTTETSFIWLNISGFINIL